MNNAAAEILRDQFPAPDTRPPSEWAEDKVRLPHSARTPTYYRHTAPWTTEPLDAIADPDVEFVTVMKSTQTGGTTIYEVFIPWVIAEHPGSTLIVCQTDDDAKLLSQTRLQKVLAATGPTREILDRAKKNSRSAVQTKLINLDGMFVEFVGPSKTNLQSRSMVNVILDEVWLYKEKGLIREAIGRVSAVWNPKIIVVSQAGWADDELDKHWRKGSQEIWSFECPECGHVQPFAIEQVAYDENERTRDSETKEWNWDEVQKTAKYKCANPECRHEFEDTEHERRRLADTGRYVRTNFKNQANHRSFRWNALTCYWTPWGKTLVEYLRAKDAMAGGSSVELEQFTQKMMAESWKEEEITLGPLTTSNYTMRSYEDGHKDPDEMDRIFAVDVQLDHYWGVIRSVRADGSTRLLWFGKIGTEEELVARQTQYGVRSKMVVVDANEWRDRVYPMCARYGWNASHGDKAESYTHFRTVGHKVKKSTRPYSQTGRAHTAAGDCFFFRWSNKVIKDTLARMRNGDTSQAWELAKDIPRSGTALDYERQMNSEHRILDTEKKTGREKWIWVKRAKHNHIWDCECIIVAVLYYLGLIGVSEAIEEDEKAAA